MLTFPFVAAGIIAEQSEAVIAKLREIGQNLGLAFQIRDDIIDVTGTFEEIGKRLERTKQKKSQPMWPYSD